MLSTNQIAGFLNVLYLKNKLRYKTDILYVSIFSIGHLVWHSKANWKFFDTVNQEHIQKANMVKFSGCCHEVTLL